MSKRSERLFSAMNGISDRHIDEAAEPLQARQLRRPTHWMRWGTAAACVTLIVMTVSIFPQISGCGSGGQSAASPPGDSPASFMSYAGPVLPLRLQEAAPGLTADRTVTLDFTPWVPEWRTNQQEADSLEQATPAQRQELLDTYHELYPEGGRWRRSQDILVKDSYTLTNTTDHPLTITAQLPFVTELKYLEALRPTLSLDGRPLDTTLMVGGAPAQEAFHNWEDVDALLADGSLLASAQEEPESLADIPATVYVVTAPELPPELGNETKIEAKIRLDHRVSGVITEFSNGGTFDWEGGTMSPLFDLTHSPSEEKQGVLVVLGAPPEQLEWSLVPRSSQSPAPPEGVHIPVTRYETDLQAVLTGVTEAFLKGNVCPDGDGAQLPKLTPACWQRLLLNTIGGREELLNFDSNFYRGAFQFRDIQMHMLSAQRVCWVTTQLTIPAGESRLVTAVSRKEPSYDYHCGVDQDSLFSYDLLPWADSNLTFTRQAARLEDREQIRIVRQNFGFDPEQGVKQVLLDKIVPVYFLDVQLLKPLPDAPPASP